MIDVHSKREKNHLFKPSHRAGQAPRVTGASLALTLLLLVILAPMARAGTTSGGSPSKSLTPTSRALVRSKQAQLTSKQQEDEEEGEEGEEESDSTESSDENSTSSSLTLEEQTSGSDFGSTTLSGRIAVSDATTLTFSVNRSNSEGLTPYGTASLGADFELNDSQTLNTDLKYSREPNEIFSRGASLALEWTILERGKDELETTLTPGFGANALSSETSSGKKLRKLSRTIIQLEPSLSLKHAITRAWSLSLAYSHAFYSTDPANLSRSVANRKVSLSGDGIVSGFVSDTWTLSSTLKLSDRWSVSASASDARLTLDNSHTRNYNGGPNWEISDAWSVGAEAGTSVPQNSSQTYYGSLEATLSW